MFDDALTELISAHPALFGGNPMPVASHLPRGWFRLVDALCIEIETALGPAQVERLHFLQIKEKVGLLRIYFKLDDCAMPSDVEPEKVVQRDRICELIDRAVDCSAVTCCMCGQPGFVRRSPGNLKTLCDLHAAYRLLVN